jgi:hypothetical protein
VSGKLLPNVPSEVYHADDIMLDGRPSLSASIAHLLVTSSPRHAWTNHPRLNPDHEPVDDDKFNVGTYAHALLLEGREVAEVVQADSWRTAWAKEAREEIRSRGKVPLLPNQWDAVHQMVDAVAVQLERLELDPIPLTDGKPEQTMVWSEDGVLCRARIDWLHTNGDVCDVKTTSRLAVGWDRGPLFDHGCDVQAALYLRGLRSVFEDKWFPAPPTWTWLVIETSPPYGLIPYRLTAPVLALGDAKVDRALHLWRECLTNDSWPLYPAEPVDAQLPSWVESRWLEKEAEWSL